MASASHAPGTKKAPALARGLASIITSPSSVRR